MKPIALSLLAVIASAEILEVNTSKMCVYDSDCDQNAYMLPEALEMAKANAGWQPFGGNFNSPFNQVNRAGGMSPGVNVCCATFPHLAADGKTVLKEKFCYPRTVLNMEMDWRYLKPGQGNPYPLAWCSATSLALAASALISLALAF